MPQSINYLLIFLKGMAMGAADVIPGVSGGTIAFITGIYYRLLSSINTFNFELYRLFRKEGFRAVWRKVDGNFLAALLGGIFFSIFSFAKLFKYLIDHHPVLIWSFFFGLIIGSVYLVARKITRWNLQVFIALALGTIISYYITIMPPNDNVDSLFYIFFCGMLAICAMILPGISGSFILLLLGAYANVLGAISGFIDALKSGLTSEIVAYGSTLAVFATGCLIGLLSFSKFLTWTLKRFYDVTIAILTGFLIGSLNKIWPWKENIQTRINSKGEIVPFLDKNVLPIDYSKVSEADALLGLTNKEPQVFLAFLLMISGLIILFVLDYAGKVLLKKSLAQEIVS